MRTAGVYTSRLRAAGAFVSMLIGGMLMVLLVVALNK